MASLETALSRAATAYYQAGDYLSSQKCLRELSGLRQHKDVKVLHNLQLINYLLKGSSTTIAEVASSLQTLVTDFPPDIPSGRGLYNSKKKRILDLVVTKYNIAILCFQQRRFSECIELLQLILSHTGDGHWLNSDIRQKILWLLVDAYLNISQGERAESIVNKIESMLVESEHILSEEVPNQEDSNNRVEDLWLAKLTGKTDEIASSDGVQKQVEEILSAITPLRSSSTNHRKAKLDLDNTKYRIALTRAFISIQEGKYDSAGVQLNRLLPRSFDEDHKSSDYNDHQLERYLTAAYLATRIEYAKGDMTRAMDLLETCRIIHGRIRSPVKAKKFQLCRQNNLGCIAFCQGEVKLARGLFSAVLIEIEDALKTSEEELNELQNDLEFSHATYLQVLMNFTLASLMCNEPSQINECFQKIAHSKVYPRSPLFWVRCAEGLLYRYAVKKLLKDTSNTLTNRLCMTENELTKAASYICNAQVLLKMMNPEETEEISKSHPKLHTFFAVGRAYCAWEMGDKFMAKKIITTTET